LAGKRAAYLLAMFQLCYINTMNGLPPDMFDRKYRKIRRLGEGSYGEVFLCEATPKPPSSIFDKIFLADRTLDSEVVAVKVYKKPNNRSQGIDFSCLREITCLQQF
jgi:serine/threonine protein kinase